MKMKKLFTLLLVLILSLSVMLALVACGGGDGDGAGDNTADGGAGNGANTGGDNGGNTGGDNGGNTGGDNGGNTGGDNGGESGGSEGGSEGGNDYSEFLNEDGELILFDEGRPTFKFVVGTDASSVRQEIDALASTLSGLCSGTVAVETATSSKVVDVEILIGSVNNRGDEYKYNKYDLGMQGYVVKQVGSKIIVQGGSSTSLATAVSYLKATVFEIKKSNDDFEDFAMASAKNRESIQTGYNVSEITIAGDTVKNYTITYPDNKTKDYASLLQNKLYEECGIRVETSREDKATGKKVAIRLVTNTGEGNGFFVNVDEDGNLTIICEIEARFSDTFDEFIEAEILSQSGTAEFGANYTYTKDIRKVYYSDFGAKGDGVTDDFFALKATHDYANANLLDVYADPNATYYIGNANGTVAIPVRTNTYFRACTFIFDDENVSTDYAIRNTSIFAIKPDVKEDEYSASAGNLPFTTLASGAENIGWAPGFEALIVLNDVSQRRYRRYGLNQDNGQIQQEIIHVDALGNVDPLTPVQWDYNVGVAKVFRTDDRKIVMRGEDENGNRATVITRYNDAPNEYLYYSRNFYITRSNFTFSGVEHQFTNYVLFEDGGHGAPYNGFTSVQHCTNVTIDNCIFENPPVYYDVVTGGNMGSYEIAANLANDVTWQNCTQSNFYEPDGTVVFQGCMGTNECKNLTFDNMFTCSFDAHRGVYNVTVKDSTCEHLNFIGAGDIIMENVTMYVDGRLYAAINHRGDYGSTWWGDMYIDGLTIKYNKDHPNKDRISVINFEWYNWDFYYQPSMAQNITIKNLVIAEYECGIEGGLRYENITGYNKIPINLYSDAANFYEDVYNSDTVDGMPNLNKTIPPKKITIDTAYTGKYAELGITNPLYVELPVSEGGYYNGVEYLIGGVPYTYETLPEKWLNKK